MIQIRQGDCKEVLLNLEVGAVICDPPYGLEFMGKDWDRLDWQSGGGFSAPGLGDRRIEWPSFSAFGKGTANPTCAKCGGRARGANRCTCDVHEWKPVGKRRKIEYEGLAQSEQANTSRMQFWHHEWLSVAFGALQPGGVIKAFGGTRTFHRLAAAMEDAGFVDIHLEAWGYGSGFPKSMDVSKAIDKAAGAEREVVGFKIGAHLLKSNAFADKAINGHNPDVPVTAHATEAAKLWDGWGTALKPAWEPVVVGRKP
jgi:hypothetical protein